VIFPNQPENKTLHHVLLQPRQNRAPLPKGSADGRARNPLRQKFVFFLFFFFFCGKFFFLTKMSSSRSAKRDGRTHTASQLIDYNGSFFLGPLIFFLIKKKKKKKKKKKAVATNSIRARFVKSVISNAFAFLFFFSSDLASFDARLHIASEISRV
jgi:hypothetical protein